MSESKFPSAFIENEFLRLEYLTSVGPRIIGLYSKQADVELLAPSFEKHWTTPHGEYYLYGGHRIWKAPEESFYNCPEDNVSVIKDAEKITLCNRVDASGLQKEIAFYLEGNSVRLTHRIIWHGAEPIEMAPWTITQVTLGGVAILPQSSVREGSAPTRSLAIFPYSSLTEPRLELHDDVVLVHGTAAENFFKVGSYNLFGWAAYLLENALFIKRFPVGDFRKLPDMGSNAEVYVHDAYLELETLGELVWLKPGEAVTFEETWEVIPGVYFVDLDGARKIMKQLS
jgi:hypothetical protein